MAVAAAHFFKGVAERGRARPLRRDAVEHRALFRRRAVHHELLAVELQAEGGDGRAHRAFTRGALRPQRVMARTVSWLWTRSLLSTGAGTHPSAAAAASSKTMPVTDGGSVTLSQPAAPVRSSMKT